ncbi:MAG: hypothetical protein AAB215_01555 [Planctomycetota bacterium]
MKRIGRYEPEIVGIEGWARDKRPWTLTLAFGRLFLAGEAEAYVFAPAPKRVEPEPGAGAPEGTGGKRTDEGGRP